MFDGQNFRVRQVNESFCGPAALEILLRLRQVDLDQRQLVRLAGVEKLIYWRGVRVDELAVAVEKAQVGLRLWYKQSASLQDLEILVNNFNYPVGVEWQGLFRETDDQRAQMAAKWGYSGHYSVVKGISVNKDVLVMTDPYRAFFESDRVFGVRWFEKRWWDWNLVEVRKGMKRWVKQRQILFVVAPEGERGFGELGMNYYRVGGSDTP